MKNVFAMIALLLCFNVFATDHVERLNGANSRNASYQINILCPGQAEFKSYNVSGYELNLINIGKEEKYQLILTGIAPEGFDMSYYLPLGCAVGFQH